MINLDKYKSNLILEVNGVEKLIEEWDSELGVVGSGHFGYDLSDISESLGLCEDEMGEDVGRFIFSTISSSIHVDMDSLFIGGDGFVSTNIFEDGEANQITNEDNYDGKLHLCQYVFNITLNGVRVDSEDLYRLLKGANLSIEVNHLK